MAEYNADFLGGGSDDEEEEEAGGFPCPAPWFTRTLEEWSLVEKTGCSVLEIKRDMDMDDRFRHLAAISIMEKARPFLESKARSKAKADMTE